MVELKESGSVPVAPTPNPQRRPRVREVSSRFMSPLVSPSTTTSSNDHHNPIRAKSPLYKPVLPPSPSDFYSRHRRSNSVQRQRNSDQETDENRPEISVFRSSETLTGTHSRVAVKLFKERRVDTPTVASTLLRSRRANACSLSMASESAAAKLLHSSGLSSGCSRDPSPLKSSDSGRPDDNDSAGNGGDCIRPSANPLSRSLTLPFSGCVNGRSVFDSIRATDKSASLSLKGLSSGKGGGCLPPMPPVGSSKVGVANGRKVGRKVLTQQDDQHRLKMLNNHYLQYRFANAKADASMNSQKRESETMLYSLGVKVSELQDSVQRKRDEVRQLQQAKALSTILEAQMPYLDDWSQLEGDYSSAVLQTTQRLLNASSQLPLAGNTRVDVRELSDALSSAAKAMDIIFAQVHTFFPQAEEVANLASGTAVVFSGEQALLQECKDLLCKANASQVVESCTRSQVMQIHQLNHLACPPQQE